MQRDRGNFDHKDRDPRARSCRAEKPFRDVSLPLRVAVTRDGTDVLYSELHSIAATLSESQPSKPWATVIENVQIPDQGTLRILLGFDDNKTAVDLDDTLNLNKSEKILKFGIPDNL